MKKNLVPFPQTAASQQMIQFGGVNYSQGAVAGELADSHNMSTREFPCLSQRRGREKVGEYSAGTSIFVHNKLIVVDGATLKCDGAVVGNVQPGEKEFAVVNTKLCIWPDKKYLDLTNMEFGALDGKTVSVETEFYPDGFRIHAESYGHEYLQGEAYYSASSARGALYRSCKKIAWENGELVTEEEQVRALYPMADECYTAPAQYDTLEVGDIILLEGNEVDGVHNPCCSKWDYGNGSREYKESPMPEADRNGMYAILKEKREVINQTYEYAGAMAHYIRYEIVLEIKNVRQPTLSVEKVFSVGNYICISGCTEIEENNTPEDERIRITQIDQDGRVHVDFSFVMPVVSTEPGVTEDATITEYAKQYTETSEVTIWRPLPDVTHICSHNNRLWGVEGGERVWGSALGDPTNFYTYEGVSTDSYSVAVGSDGAFTGCCSYGTEVLFFKEDKLYKLYGTAPDNYELYENTMRGVMEGSHKSLTVLNETLFFHSREGVCVYTGGVPSLISSGFGLRRFRNAVGGTDGERYYIAMEDEKDGSGGVWVFDPNTGLWQQEDKERAVGFCYMDGDFYMLSGAGVLTKGRSDTFEAEGVWSATFAPMTEMVHERKCYSTILLRYTPHEGSVLKVEVSTDGGAFSEVAIRKHDAKAGTAVLPIRPNRCDKFQIRLSGVGYCRIESMVRKMRAGGLW